MKIIKSDILRKKPHIKGIICKLFTVKPKKPNSAIRKAAKVYLPSIKFYINAYIPGIGHSLKVHNEVLIKGGRTKDLIGFRYKIIRGVYDCDHPKK